MLAAPEKHATFLLAVVALGLLAGHCCASNKYAKVQEFLNKYRRGKPPLEYLEACEQKLVLLNSTFLVRTLNRSLIKALEDTIRLRVVLNGMKCDLEEMYIILDFVDCSIGHKFFQEKSVCRCKPFDAMIHYVSFEHAKQCRDKYPEAFSKAYAEFDEVSKQRAEFKRKRFQLELEARGTRGATEYFVKYTFKADKDRMVDAYEHIRDLSEGDPEECDYDEMFLKYLYRPCEEFVAKLGRSILSLARIDAEMYEGTKFYNLDDPNLVEYHQAIAQNRACRNVIDSEDQVKREVKFMWLAGFGKRCSDSMGSKGG